MMEPSDLAEHLRESLLERLREMVREKQAAAAPPVPPPSDPPPLMMEPSAPPPAMPKLARLTPEQRAERAQAGMQAAYAVADLLAPPEAVATKMGAAMAADAVDAAMRDVLTWIPESNEVLNKVAADALASHLDHPDPWGVKSAAETEFVGRMLAHALAARRAGLVWA